ncbi:unnamed protein product [Didymodactylos carnosus]|uniref:Hexosyltransferase n=1 Tax=Didymodactylos carnosus TaxID=1234261 RepID=A0A814RJH3_9BILA|nr:unnamed protein product [Didymodactylos carnosus]CAF1134748.1 unnamed protein product [Didymodactylos carnosus]CAF3573507.1 unnamed protein product [Didymodactylos carnosus]CAF3898476.1 unnamed protein product [Didymodactylos carnosus]
MILRILCLSYNKQPNFYNQFLYKSKSCSSSSSTKFLTIGVISSYERLHTYLPIILKTWAKINDSSIEIIFFIEENPRLPVSYDMDDYYIKLFSNVNEFNSCVYTVRLQHVIDQYPPQLKGFYLIKYLYLFYGRRTSWILRLDDNAYVHIPKLIKWLKSLDERKLLYIGQGGTGRQNENIYFKNQQYFCMGGSGVILSQTILNKLGPHLDHCLQTVYTNHEDVEIGRCIIQYVHVSCTNAFDSKTYFYHHYGSKYSFGHGFTTNMIQNSFIMHPIKNLYTFYHIEVYNQRYKQQQDEKRLNSLVRQINNVIPLPKIKSSYRSFTTFIPRINLDLTKELQLKSFDIKWNSYLQSIVENCLEDLRYRWNRKTNWTLTNGTFVFGYYQSLPTKGVELIFEMLFNVMNQQPAIHPSLFVRKRIYTKAGFTNRLKYHEIEVDDQIDNDKLNLIVVSSNKDDALKRFIINFKQQILNSTPLHRIITLTCVYFHRSETTATQLDDDNSPLKLINELAYQYPAIVHKPVIYNVSFNHGKGRQLGSRHFDKNDLLLFVDVDLVFTYDALVNIRRFMLHQIKHKTNELSKCTAYFPIVYSHTNNDHQCLLSHANVEYNITSNHGTFSIYGFGTVATTKNDLDSVGGWETNNTGWGVEDVNLYTRFIEAGCMVHRVAQPDLRHCFHKKMCDGIKDKKRQRMCREAESSLLGSHSHIYSHIVRSQLLKV